MSHSLSLVRVNEEAVDQMAITRYYGSAKKPICSSSPQLKLRKSSREKKKPKGPKSDTTKVISGLATRKTNRRERKRGRDNDSCEGSEAETNNNSVVDRAKRIQENLTPEFPSLIKLMRSSHVTKGFWLGLPKQFCKSHLPKYDKTVVLEAESGKKYYTNFLAEKYGLSGGWKGFSCSNKLVEGDIVVFQLVQPCNFKTYIVRVMDFAGVDGVIGLLNLDISSRNTDLENEVRRDVDMKRCQAARGEQRPRPPPLAICEKKVQKTMILGQEEQAGSSVEDLRSEDTEDNFVDFENFEIVVHGTNIDTELALHLRTKYYELCKAQHSYLHRDLVKTVSPRHGAGIIAGTVDIADAIRACQLSTARDEISIWENTLEAFELLGMEVEFLRDRLNQLICLAGDSETELDLTRIVEAKLERDDLEIKMLELERARDMLNCEIKELEKVEIKVLLFREEANAPW